MLRNHLWNLNWQFKEGFDPAEIGQTELEGMQAVHLPHTMREVPYSCFSHEMTWIEGHYAKVLPVPADKAGQRVVLEFEGVMTWFELFVNGVSMGDHKGGYSRAYFDITDAIRFGEDNLIQLHVDAHELPDIPPFGYVIDYLTYGGVYRDVWLYYTAPCYVERMMTRYDLEGNVATLYPELFVKNCGAADVMTACVTVRDGEAVFDQYEVTVAVPEGASYVVLPKHTLPQISRWSLEEPKLYTVEVALGEDTQVSRVGFRTVECKPEGFYLNGEYVKLCGLDRHQSYPYAGYAMGPRAQRKDADILKHDLCTNVVRTSHYMQSRYFLDRCDEIGLLVFEEVPGWGHIGGDAFKEVVMQDVCAMVEHDFDHPSIFIWGTRLNETVDDDPLYSATHALAKALDPTRATTGVRYLIGSSLQEDVYAMNDFIFEGGELVLRDQQTVTQLPYKVPYIVTEYNGHVFPCKMEDHEQRREQHAMRHAKVQSVNMQRRDALGAIGWCAFDYNTHGDCGAGDKICYHGVMDMFRIPKYAAFVYASQCDPSERVVLEPCSVFARGEREGNGGMFPVTVLTNCDYIEVITYGDHHDFYYPSTRYLGLKHPPIIVDRDSGRWQDTWQGVTVIGYVAGREVARREYMRDAWLEAMEVTPDDDELVCDYVDETRFVCRFVDQKGNLMPFFPGMVRIETEGDIALIGPEYVAARGGVLGFWVKTLACGTEGEARVRVQPLGCDLPEQVFTLALHHA